MLRLLEMYRQTSIHSYRFRIACCNDSGANASLTMEVRQGQGMTRGRVAGAAQKRPANRTLSSEPADESSPGFEGAGEDAARKIPKHQVVFDYLHSNILSGVYK